MKGVEIFKNIYKEFDKHNITKSDIDLAIKSLPKNKIFLVGDFILDIYTFCEAIGKTSKTPTISVKRKGSEYFWGGAGLFATNFLELGAEVKFLTIAGNDWGSEYIQSDKHRNPRMDLNLTIDETRPTTLKERFWVDGYKLLQVDTVDNKYISNEILEKIKNQVQGKIEDCNVVLICDPRHGLLSPELISFIKNTCKIKSKTLIVDTQVSSRSGNIEEYVGVNMICVNETEARYFLRDEKSHVNDILNKLYEQVQVKRLILKLGLNGLIGFDIDQGFFQLPAIPVTTVDPIGSGDAFLSAVSLTYKPEIKLMASVFVATCAGSLSVTKMGTIPNNLKELTEFVEEKANEIFAEK